MEKTIESLRRLIAEKYLQIPPQDLPIDQPIISNGLVDSFSLVDLALQIQEDFGIVVADSDLNADRFDTIEELAAFILKTN